MDRIEKKIAIVLVSILIVTLVISVWAFINRNYLNENDEYISKTNLITTQQEVVLETTKTEELENYKYDESKVLEAVASYQEKGYKYSHWIQEYDTFGDYLNFGKHKPTSYRNQEGIMQLDEDGIPKGFYNDDYYYNPVTTAQYALTKYGEYINGDETKKEDFIKAADVLLSLSTDGAYKYSFKYRYYVTGQDFEPPWLSGLSQGQALSVYARAYNLTKDEKYLNEGAKAFEVLIKPIEDGGTLGNLSYLDPELKDYITFEEYPLSPNTYTLNGFIFAMLGVYDWWQLGLDDSELAKEYFEETEKTLKLILKYYDGGGFPTYDLAYINYQSQPNYNITYHIIHIGLMHAMYEITGDEYYSETKEKWIKFVE